MNIADIVISLNGRDAGKRFIVIATDEEYSLIADGKGRRVEKPKRKKNKHLEFEEAMSGIVKDKLSRGDMITNSELRKALTVGGALKCQKTT